MSNLHSVRSKDIYDESYAHSSISTDPVYGNTDLVCKDSVMEGFFFLFTKKKSELTLFPLQNDDDAIYANM